MNIALCSSSSDIKFSFSESLRGKNFESYVRVSDLNKKGSLHIYNHDVKNVAISSHLVPQHLEGYAAGKKRLEEPVPKLQFIRTLLIDNYDSYTYNIYQELSVINGCKDSNFTVDVLLNKIFNFCFSILSSTLSHFVPPVVVRNDEWTWKDCYHYLYEEKAFDNIVISPGPGSPSCPVDIGICLRLLSECGDIPILGVCLGHQALGYVHGAQVVHASEPVHGRLSDLEHNGCVLFNDIPSGKNSEFKVVRYHSLVVDPESLPNELIPIAWTYSSETLPFLVAERSDSFLDAYARQNGQRVPAESLFNNLTSGKSSNIADSKASQSQKVLMGIMHSTRPHYGLQFHPESVATRHGRQIFKNFGEITKDYWSRMRSSSASGRTDKYAACMQVPNVSRMFQDASRYDEQLVYRSEERKHMGMCNTVNLSDSSSGIKFLKLTWKKLEFLANEVGGAGNIFRELFGEARNTFWLDSATTEKRRARFSFMGGKGGSLWKQVTFRLANQSGPRCRAGGYLSIVDAQGYSRKSFTEDGFFEFLDKELQAFCYDAKDYEGLPFEFFGGYVGYIGYDLKIECGVASNHHKSRAPDACFFFADNLLVIDHDTDAIYVVSIQDDTRSNTSWFDEVEQKICNLKNNVMHNSLSWGCQHSVNSQCKSGFMSEKSREQYINDIRKCQKFIKDGESYELCLTTQMKKKVGDIDALALYLNLREKNPAPYAAWLNFSEEDLCVCCSSPERFLRLDRNGILEAKPIKGTIARGATPEEDELLKLQLQYSEKDQAENLMIVDLLRNDLGRVCEPGSVHVPHLMEIESYATVHTMVSTIRGKKRSNLSALDCVTAAFPGGSMTGAPKLRSMELLDSLESSSRGIYSGCIGFFSYNQTFDLNIVIRTVVIHHGEASIGAGGAITALSNPDDEYAEMILKTRAPTNAVLEYEQTTS